MTFLINYCNISIVSNTQKKDMLMTETIILTLLGLFYLDNHEFIHKAKEQMEKGYEWEYTGYTKWDEKKSPAILVNRDTNSHVYWILRKPKK